MREQENIPDFACKVELLWRREACERGRREGERGREGRGCFCYGRRVVVEKGKLGGREKTKGERGRERHNLCRL